MLNRKLIKLLSSIFFIAAAANFIIVKYLWLYHEDDYTNHGKPDFIETWDSTNATEEAFNYFGLPVELFSNGGGIIQVSATFMEETIDEVDELLERIQSISWARLHKISLETQKEVKTVKVTAFFVK